MCAVWLMATYTTFPAPHEPELPVLWVHRASASHGQGPGNSCGGAARAGAWERRPQFSTQHMPHIHTFDTPA